MEERKKWNDFGEKGARFSLGRVCMTPGVDAEVAEWDRVRVLQRHVVGDWGDLDDQDKACNEQALREGTRLLSAYTVPSPEPEGSAVKVWVITEADRSATTIMLPEEY